METRQRYVRCDWISSAIRNDAIIYKLPYEFDKSYYSDATCSKSTCPDFWSYDRVQSVDYVNNRPSFVNNFMSYRPQFPNIRYLSLIFLFDYNILSVYPSLNYLTRLEITVNRSFDYSQLQILLDRTSNLYSLRLSKLTNLCLTLSQIRSNSIRRLDFIEHNASNDYFNGIECTALINSSIGCQCEVLLIYVAHRNIILNLSNLRMLIIRSEDDKWNTSQDLDELFL
jgi:hypothetical protein